MSEGVGDLIKRHHRVIWKAVYAKRFLADCVQDVDDFYQIAALEIIRKSPAWNKTQRESPYWIHMIVCRAIVNKTKLRRAQKRSMVRDYDVHVPHLLDHRRTPDPDAKMDAETLLGYVSPRIRPTLTLFFGIGEKPLTQQEIADRLGWGHSTVQQAMYRGLRTMKAVAEVCA